jgi:hypothetical protein
MPVPFIDTCVCGHSPEEHGNDAKHPGSTACDHENAEHGGCDCAAYEADGSEAAGEDDEREDEEG